MGYAVIILPMIPGVLWLWVIYRTDWYDPEPKRLILATFGLGLLAILPAFAGERLAELVYPSFRALEQASLSEKAPMVPVLVGCFLVVGPCEEVAKFLAVRLFVFRRPEFDEPLDGIIYAAAAALGFASLENVLYVVDWHTGHLHWRALGVRSLLALPGHVIFSTTWGYALGRKRFAPRFRVWPMVMGAAALHGLYDFLLFYGPTRPLIWIYMSLMAPVLVRQIRQLRAESPFRRLTRVTPPPAAASDAAPDAGAT